MTYSGVISGAGNVYINCSGHSVTFLNAETFTGTIDIEYGTLQLGNRTTNGTLASSATIEVCSGAVLAYDESASATYSNTIEGAGTINNLNYANTTITLSGTHSGFTGSLGTGVRW